ncbi:MAG: Ca2+-dependent phosphoinositide-specific phospholipase C [bacterium]|nr:hypothetical protein [Myxococcales bacterium]
MSLLLCLCAVACDTVEGEDIADGGPYPPLDVIQLKGYHRSAWYRDEEGSTSPPAYTGHDRPRIGTQLADLGARIFHFGYQRAQGVAFLGIGWEKQWRWRLGPNAGCGAEAVVDIFQSECVFLPTCMDFLALGSPESTNSSGSAEDPYGHLEYGGLARLPVAAPAPIFILLEFNPPVYPPEMVECIVTEHDRHSYGLIPEWDTAEVEDAIRRTFDREAIFAPQDLKRGYATYRESLEVLGWPRMEEVRGKFIFILLDEGAIRDGHDGRVDWQVEGLQDPDDPVIFTLGRREDDPNGAFFSVPAGEVDRIRRLVDAGAIVHAHSLDAAELDRAREAGAHLLTGLELEDIAIEGPAACNPVTMPRKWPGCVAEDFEVPLRR